MKIEIPDNITSEDIEIAIVQWIFGKNGERNRAILHRRLIDGVKFEALAEEFDLSVRQTKNIVYKCSSKIFKHLPK